MKSELTISVTDFKATCLAVLEQIRTHTLKRVVVTKHGKTIAEILPPASPKPKGKHDWNPFAHLAERVVLPPGFDPTAPAMQDEWSSWDDESSGSK